MSNSFKFTGQYYDSEIGQYYLRARMYDPHLYRFISRDIIDGRFEEPLTLHKYLYCINDPVNGIDLSGLWTFHVTGSFTGLALKGVMRQSGFVIDGHGNIGWMNVTGHGWGFPLVGALGVSFGGTDADTIFDLEGPGRQVGGSATIANFNVGFDAILGGEDATFQKHDYSGWEVTVGWGWPPLMLEYHAFETSTKIYPSDTNWREVLDSIMSTWEGNVKTLGQAYLYLGVQEALDQLSRGNVSYGRHLKQMVEL